ncbi:MAG: YqeG family HAD IIIA-type phosphatase [Oscillospiraceae bacterium]|jgi:HAD superfamily phosphatase (TIGR01668 family)|nr:YqeG family HAD IIIA-type phosphatase [Oscillospiraceae bacterium]
MSFSPFPKYKFRALTDISPKFLRGAGIELLLLDLDNTIAPYGQTEPSREVLEWARALAASGTALYIVSNSRRSGRVAEYSRALGIPYVNRAKKPFPRKPREVMTELRTPAAKTALVGDQIYTDTLAANLAGVSSILVKPIRLSNIFLAIRYGLETPFRIWGRTL